MSKHSDLKLKILENYFSIDGNIATLELVYDTFAELINPNFGDSTIEKLNDKLLSDIKEAVLLLPSKFKLNLHIRIKDFGEYDKEECREIVKKNIYLAAYRTAKENRQKLICGWSLIGAGAIVLIVSYFLHNYSLWFDLINISGTLFVWEGVNKAFLERSIEGREIKKIARKVNEITLDKAESDENDESPNKTESCEADENLKREVIEEIAAGITEEIKN